MHLRVGRRLHLGDFSSDKRFEGEKEEEDSDALRSTTVVCELVVI